MIASYRGSVEIVDYLYERGADASVADRVSMTEG